MTEHLISRPAAARPCPHCCALVLTGIEGGATTTVDITPADIHAEITALIATPPRYSYDMLTEPKGLYLIHRDIFRIKHRDHPVMLSHRCPDGRNPVMPYKPPPKIPYVSPIQLPPEPPF
jgi:hypothetical protein